MKVMLRREPATEVAADWLVVGVYEGDDGMSVGARALDEAAGGLVSRLVRERDVSGKSNELVPVVGLSGIAASRVLVVGLGKRKEVDAGSLSQAARAAAKRISEQKRSSVAFALLDESSVDLRAHSAAILRGAIAGSQGPDLYKVERKRHPFDELLFVAGPDLDQGKLEAGIRRGEILGRAVNWTRELVNQPPQVLTPTRFAQRAVELAEGRPIRVTVFDESEIEKERMRALLAVAAGSNQPPRFVLLEYNGTADGPRLALVGKGLTFDSGGLSLKPSGSMEDMKGDMAGAATVLGAIRAIAELELPVRVLAVAALAENMPGPGAMKLGDVLRARNGKTIEVMNTDAEGRLVLADALSYTVDQKVSHIVDLATLTGACMVALGKEVTGLMSNNQPWAEQVQSAAARAGERLWQLPMFEDYAEELKSDVADFKNVGSRWGGAITAAKFLEKFVAEMPWVHLDIAGPSWSAEESATADSGGTGALVSTLVELAEAYG